MIERRALAYRIDELDVVELLSLFGSGFPDVVRVPELHLPEGSVVSHAYHDRLSRQFVIVVLHPSFPLWPDGGYPERAGGPLGWYVHNVAVDKGGGDEGPRVMWQRTLVEEVQRLKAVFSDLRQDSPAIDAAYRQGVADGIAQEQKRQEDMLEGNRRAAAFLSQVSALEAMLEHGLQVSADEVRSAVGFSMPNREMPDERV